MSLFGDKLLPTSPTEVQVRDCLASCIGIHRTFCETYDEKETFVRILNPHCTKDGHTLAFVATLKNCDPTTKNALIAEGYDVRDENGKYVFRQEMQLSGYHIIKNDWFKLSSILLSKGLRAYTDGNDYRMYLPLSSKVQLSSTSVIYAVMFFLGSVTRYNPYFFDSLMNEKEQWLISEFLNTQPAQFLYYLISYMVGKPVYHSRIATL